MTKDMIIILHYITSAVLVATVVETVIIQKINKNIKLKKCAAFSIIVNSVVFGVISATWQINYALSPSGETLPPLEFIIMDLSNRFESTLEILTWTSPYNYESLIIFIIIMSIKVLTGLAVFRKSINRKTIFILSVLLANMAFIAVLVVFNWFYFSQQTG